MLAAGSLICYKLGPFINIFFNKTHERRPVDTWSPKHLKLVQQAKIHPNALNGISHPPFCPLVEQVIDADHGIELAVVAVLRAKTDVNKRRQIIALEQSIEGRAGASKHCGGIQTNFLAKIGPSLSTKLILRQMVNRTTRGILNGITNQAMQPQVPNLFELKGQFARGLE